MGEVRNGDQKVRKYFFPEIFYGRQTVSYEEILSRIIWVGGVKNFLSKKSSPQSEDLGPSLTIQEFFSKKYSWFFMQQRLMNERLYASSVARGIKQPIMRIEDRLFDRSWVRSAMATRKCGFFFFRNSLWPSGRFLRGKFFKIYLGWRGQKLSL